MSMKGKNPIVEEGNGINESVPTLVALETRESGHFGQNASVVSRFSHGISMAPVNPRMSIRHSRTQSEPFFSSPTDECDEDLVSMYFDMDKFPSAMEDLGFAGSEVTVKAASSSNIHTGKSVKPSDEERQHVELSRSQSIDGSPSNNLDVLAPRLGCLPASASRKFKSAARLAEAILVDPMRARRMISNRQSAARSREKMRYVGELERKVESLQKQETALLQENSSLASENNELKMHQQKLEQEIKLQYALDKTLQEELQQLKFVTAQFIMHGGQMMNLSSSSFSRNQQSNHYEQVADSFLAAYNLQRLELHSLHQQQLLLQPQPPSVLTINGAMSSHSQKEENSDDRRTSRE